MNISTKFEVNPMSSLSGNVWQALRQSEEYENSMKYAQILIRSEDPLMMIPTSLSKMHGKCMANQRPLKFNEVWPKINQVSGTPNEYFHQVCPEMRRKCVVYQRPWNDRNSVKCDQKSIPH